jgi:hypothetical protein
MAQLFEAQLNLLDGILAEFYAGVPWVFRIIFCAVIEFLVGTTAGSLECVTRQLYLARRV